MLATIKEKLSDPELRLRPRLALAGIAVLATLLALAVVFYLWRGSHSFRPLYGAGEAYPAAEVMQVLDAEGVSYRLHPQSGQVLVRDDQLAQARMLLSAKGIKVSVPPGYELFDKDTPLGTSQFVQNVRLRRSLEGELARTVMTLKGIDLARVHLAQEESSSFAISRRGPTKASVMVQLAPGYRLSSEQVVAIINLVANSMPNLDPKDVSVVDQYGTLLSRGVDAWGSPSQNWGAVEEYQQKATANVEQVLAPILGPGNFRVSVAADFDFSQREETVQTYGEDPRLRSEVLRNESVLDQLALGVPGSLSNRPVPQAQQQEGDAEGDQNPAATSLREEVTRQLDYDQSIVHVRHPSFALRQQSIAVVLNANAAPEGGWGEAERAELEATIRSAVGFNAARGDLLTVSVFPFALVETAPETVPWWENTHVHSLIKMALGGLVSLLILLLVVRPAVRNLTRAALPEPVVREDEQEEVAEALPMPSERLPAPEAQGEGGKPVFSELSPLAEISLPDPGSGLEKQIEHLQMLANTDPERVSEVIKHWIGRNEREVDPAG